MEFYRKITYNDKENHYKLYSKFQGGYYVFIRCITRKLSGKMSVVLPEGEDERVLAAAVELQATDYVTPVLLK